MTTTNKETVLTGPGPLIVEGKQADNERLKADSNFIPGTIVEDLQDQTTGSYTADN